MENNHNSRVVLLLNSLSSSTLEKRHYLLLFLLGSSSYHKRGKILLCLCTSSEQEISKDILEKPRGRVAKRRHLIQSVEEDYTQRVEIVKKEPTPSLIRFCRKRKRGGHRTPTFELILSVDCFFMRNFLIK